ncbi:predicted protein [Streptomyces viridosporus ATCC 14672]|uniref:Predicted protein n=1 Tax=Streptomyces viridosporus (strain ATCC 14672 / DSM 40746 / JCM 4963 / KCTC 9882 / NRRL B-12104 / FH 1290) TaxID=566461 RepID=D6A251_STRV1|nr:predicted protein [Streptomyces viridosporus ATCC 14672]
MTSAGTRHLLVCRTRVEVTAHPQPLAGEPEVGGREPMIPPSAFRALGRGFESCRGLNASERQKRWSFSLRGEGSAAGFRSMDGSDGIAHK